MCHLFGGVRLSARKFSLKATDFKIDIPELVTMREKVYYAVREHILEGKFSPGDRVTETRLSRELEISRTPVREALHLLENEGLLESTVRVGYRLKQITWNEIEEICEMRMINETLAARWAIDRMKPCHLDALEENLRKAESDAQQNEVKSFIKRDGQFHEIISLATGSNHLVEICDRLRQYMLLYRVGSIFHLDTVRGALEGHRQIFNCIKKKDSRNVADAIRKHLDYAKSVIRQYAVD